jgi:Anp1
MNEQKRDFGFALPVGRPRWHPSVQIERRRVLAKSRTALLFRALAAKGYVLWLDVDGFEHSPEIVAQPPPTGKTIALPNCVKQFGGPTFDRNGWRDHGRRRLHELHWRLSQGLLPDDARLRESETYGLGLLAYEFSQNRRRMAHLEIRRADP